MGIKKHFSIKPEEVESYLAQFSLSELHKVRLEDAAKVFKCSERTLQLELQGQGTKFQDLKNKITWSAFEQMIKNPDLQIWKITRLLGYADQSILSRMCRDRYGMSPTQMREEALKKKKK